jgi:hypothetical protein
MEITNSFGAFDSTTAMFSQADCVVKVVSLSIELEWIDSAFECFAKRSIADLRLIAPKNHVDYATFSSSCFTEDDDVWNGLLRDAFRLVAEASNITATTLPGACRGLRVRKTCPRTTWDAAGGEGGRDAYTYFYAQKFAFCVCNDTNDDSIGDR